MSYLKAKSEFNLSAAKVLIDEHSYYAPSVHCSYYGCFQHIKSKLNQLGITYEQMDSEIASSDLLSSNQYPIQLIKNKLTEVSDSYFAKQVNDRIKKLKLFRVESDYHNVEVNYDTSKEALRLSTEIIKFINEKI